MESFRAERLKSADRNGDGRLDQAEFETFWLEVTRPMRVRAFQFLDADGDGIVTAAEIQRPSDRMFARMDRDGDGFLTPVTPAERERMRERMREEHRERGPRRD
jgi:Ca2+-binding EF-hand superfamily protein